MHVFTRYIATYIVLPAGLIGAFALATTANADVTGFNMAAPLPKAGSEARLTE